MIVQRITVPYKPGKRAEALLALKECGQSLHEAGIFRSMPRIYTPIDEENITTGDFEFESIADMEARWAQANEHPAMQAFGKRYDPLVACDDVSKTLEVMTFEILNVA